MLMFWRRSDEHHLGRLEWVLLSKPELECVLFSLVYALVSSFKVDVPNVLFFIDHS